MIGRPIRLNNQFGRRYISLQKFCAYTADVELEPQAPSERLFEFMEREGLLYPAVRVEFPAEVARRIEQEMEPIGDIIEPIESDTPRLHAAVDLFDKLNSSRWSDPDIFGEHEHVLDAAQVDHAPFIQKTFNAESFLPWEKAAHPYLLSQWQRNLRFGQIFGYLLSLLADFPFSSHPAVWSAPSLPAG